jgi:hypothetical protein
MNHRTIAVAVSMLVGSPAQRGTAAVRRCGDRPKGGDAADDETDIGLDPKAGQSCRDYQAVRHASTFVAGVGTREQIILAVLLRSA